MGKETPNDRSGVGRSIDGLVIKGQHLLPEP